MALGRHRGAWGGRRLTQQVVDHEAEDRRERSRIKESLDRAQLSTIHSFCQALLYSFAAEAGVDPSFKVQDEVMAERRFQERWRIYLEGLGNDGEASRVIDRALSLGLTTWNLADLATALTQRAELAGLLAES